MKKCKYCGFDIEEELGYCPRCGAKCLREPSERSNAFLSFIDKIKKHPTALLIVAIAILSTFIGVRIGQSMSRSASHNNSYQEDVSRNAENDFVPISIITVTPEATATPVPTSEPEGPDAEAYYYESEFNKIGYYFTEGSSLYYLSYDERGMVPRIDNYAGWYLYDVFLGWVHLSDEEMQDLFPEVVGNPVKYFLGNFYESYVAEVEDYLELHPEMIELNPDDSIIAFDFEWTMEDYYFWTDLYNVFGY